MSGCEIAAEDCWAVWQSDKPFLNCYGGTSESPSQRLQHRTTTAFRLSPLPFPPLPTPPSLLVSLHTISFTIITVSMIPSWSLLALLNAHAFLLCYSSSCLVSFLFNIVLSLLPYPSLPHGGRIGPWSGPSICGTNITCLIRFLPFQYKCLSECLSMTSHHFLFSITSRLIHRFCSYQRLSLPSYSFPYLTSLAYVSHYPLATQPLYITTYMFFTISICHYFEVKVFKKIVQHTGK